MIKPNLLIDESVKKIQHLFWFAGINIKVEQKSRMDKYRCWFIFALNFFFMICDTAAEIVWFLKGIVHNMSFMEITYQAPCIIISFLGIFKVMNLFINEEPIEALLDKLRTLEIEQRNRDNDMERNENGEKLRIMEIEQKNRSNDWETEKIMKSEMKFLHRLLNTWSILYTASSTSFMITPAILVLYNYLKNNELELLLPVSAIYPFNPFEFRYYPWVYIYQCRTVIFVMLYIAAADFLLYIFCSHLIMQFRLLQNNIKRVIPFETRTDYLSNKRQINLNMMRLVKCHQQLLSSADLLEKVYTKSSLFNFVTSSTLICLTGFNAVVIDVFFLSFLTFLLVSLMQIFLLCLYGNIFENSSTAVGDAVYNSKWYLVDTQLRKSMLLVLTRSQTPCKLTAWGFTDINMNAFMKICSTAWSYFALLQTVYTEPAAEHA